MPNAPATRQTAGTCWFHTAMNGFLLSKYGRIYLNHKLSSTNANGGAACPMPGRVRKQGAMELLRKYMKEGVSDTQANLNAFINNRTVNSGGSTKDVIQIYETLGFSPDLITQQLSAPYLDSPQGYVLSHAEITISRDGASGHAISGIVNSKGDLYIYDSNGPYIKLDWTSEKGFGLLRQYAKNMYGWSNVRIILLVVFIKRSVLQVYLNKITNDEKRKQLEIEKQLVLESELFYKRKAITNKLNGIPLASFMRYLNKGSTVNRLSSTNYWEKLNVSTINSKIKEFKTRQQNLAMAAYFRSFKSPNGHKMNINPKANTKRNISSKILSEIRKGERNTRLFSLQTTKNNKIQQAAKERIKILVGFIKNGHNSLEIKNYNTQNVRKAKINKELEIISGLRGKKNTVPQNTNTNAIKQARANLLQRIQNKEAKNKQIIKLRKNLESNKFSLQELEKMLNNTSLNTGFRPLILKKLVPLRAKKLRNEEVGINNLPRNSLVR